MDKRKKNKIAPKAVAPPVVKEKEPSYVVQVNDPKMLRRDILESLREIIIFMQGYERFRKIQEEKVALFSTLKKDLRELNGLMETKLKVYLPKGKLKGLKSISSPLTKPVEEAPHEEAEEEEPLPKKVEEKPTYAPRKEPSYRNELDELESQLKDIEGQLRRVR